MPDDSATLLQLSRRIDWRFLLPDPTLRRVVYPAEEPDELTRALAHFSEAFSTKLDSGCDLVVLRGPSHNAFVQAITANGVAAFYVELERRRWPERLRQWAAPGHLLRAARSRGFTACAYWHYPDFATANRILPLDNPAPLINVLAKHGGAKARLQQIGLAALLTSGLLARALPCISVIGYRS
jgi:hypothetical protein